MPRGRPRKPRVLETQRNLIELINEKKSFRDEMRAILKVGGESTQIWRGLMATPPGSLLEKVVKNFHAHTDIPLEIPFFISLSVISSVLLNRQVRLTFEGVSVRPDLWTVILADSGAGKTVSEQTISRAISRSSKRDLVPEKMPECASAAAFITEMQYKNNSIWIRDEFAQFLKALETQTYLAELKDYLLRIYDGHKIERQTKREHIVVENPALVIIGLCPPDAFHKYVTPESMIDGFAQRFNYVLAEPDPERDARKNPRKYAWYPLGKIEEEIREAWDRMWSAPIYPEYQVISDGFEAYKSSFELIMNAEDLPMSFHRRIMYRVLKYALIYHVLLEREGDKIDEKDIGWGTRVSVLHVKDVAKIITKHNTSELQELLHKVEALKKRIMDREGRDITPRDVVMGISAVKRAYEAKALLSLL